jgi:hypothetical protein
VKLDVTFMPLEATPHIFFIFSVVSLVQKSLWPQSEVLREVC